MKKSGVIQKEMKDRTSFFDDACQYRKPPLGLIPRYIHEEQRLSEVGGAIYRCLNEQYTIKPEWIDEYNELILRRNEK